MSASELLDICRHKGIHLWYEGDRLRYRSPEGVLDEGLRKKLTENKTAVLEELILRAKESVIEQPLSYAQQALWFLWKTVPDTPAYNVAFSARIKSQVQVGDLRVVLQTLMDRHPMLRTVYRQNGGEPIQAVHGHMDADFFAVDVSDLDDETLHAEIRKAYAQSFDLETGPLLRSRLFSKSPSAHVLLIVAHHIAMDGWSMWILLDEMRSLYGARQAGKMASLNLPAANYLDYVKWQQSLLNGEQGKKLWEYWKNQLSGDTPLLRLPCTGKHTDVFKFEGASHIFNLNAGLTQQVKAFATKQGVTLYMMLLAVYQIFLFRYTGQDDILVSTPMNGRSRPEFSSIIGCFVNPIVLRAKIHSDKAFKDYLTDVKETVLAAIAHQDYPLALLTKQLKPDRNLTRSPLFQVDFVLQKPHRSDDISQVLNLNRSARPIDFGGLEMELYYVPQQEGQLDLSLELVESEGMLWGSFKYKTDILDSAIVNRMEGHFQCLLKSAITTPQCQLSALQMVSDQEREVLVLQTLQTPVLQRRVFKSIVQKIEAQAEKQPEAVAVSCNGAALTYGELERRSNRLAHFLIDQGVAPESIIGIFLEKSPELIIAVLGILKTGAAYLPMTPDYPHSRITHMLTDTGVKLVISSSRLLDRLDAANQIVMVDGPGSLFAGYPEHAPGVNIAPNSLAYVIYTSGTTGRAKGVMVEHKSLANAYEAWKDAYGLSGVTAHLQMASFSFDVFTGDFVRALCSGAKLVLCPKEVLMSSEKLYLMIKAEAVDCAEFVPVVFRELASYLKDSGKRLGEMKVLICGSDSWSMEEYKQFRSVLGTETRLINSYGVTEATIDTMWFECRQADYPARHLVPIGKPFPGMYAYVLNSHLQPVPIGVAGELFVGGEGLARGYINRPELTAQRFVHHSFQEGMSVRLYRTGDRVRYLVDGNIELLGRMDYQIKVRGYRVEPGEIEAAIKACPGVEDAVVVACDGSDAGKELAAYVVAGRDLPASIEQLRPLLKERLPAFMIPSYLTILEAMPVTPSGKIDRKALPIPDQTRFGSRQKYRPPQTTTEKEIARVWEEVLGSSQVGLGDDFFEMGGHSLLATKVHSRLRKIFPVRLEIRHLFEEPTLEGLSNLIDTLAWIAQEQKAQAVSTQQNGDEFEI